MGARNRRIVIAAAVAVAIVLAGLGAWRWWQHSHRTALEDAMSAMPADAQRVSFTDWAAVRAALGVPSSAAPAAADVATLTDGGYDRDLTAVSSIDSAIGALQDHFGFSPTTMDWEAYSQSEQGAAMVARMPGDFDLDTVREHLRQAGFTEPSAEDGVWIGGVDLVAALDPSISPELQYVSLLDDRHLIVTSDTEDYAARAADAAAGRGASLGDSARARDLAAKTGEPAAAVLWPGDFVCADLAMSQADEATQGEAESAIAAAGTVTPLSAMALALGPDRELSAIELFEDGDQAKANLSARATLAVGEAYGLGGSFSDDLELIESRTEGAAVVLRWRPREKAGFVISPLQTGPVVFATC